MSNILHLKKLTSDNPEKAINKLIKITTGIDNYKEILNNAFSLKARLHELNEQINNRLISDEEADIRKARIIKALLYNIDELETKNKTNSIFKTTLPKWVKKLVAALFVVGTILLLSYFIPKILNTNYRTEMKDSLKPNEESRDSVIGDSSTKEKPPVYTPKIILKTSADPCDSNHSVNFPTGKISLNIWTKNLKNNDTLVIKWGDGTKEKLILSGLKCYSMPHVYMKMKEKVIEVYLLTNEKLIFLKSTKVNILSL